MSSFSERLEARMTEDQHALEAKQDKLLANTEQLLDSHKQLLDNRREESRAEQVQVNVYNVFYCFLTASPSFDSKTGTLQNLQAGNRLIRSTTPLSMDELRTTLSTTPLSRSPSHLSPFGFPHSPSSQYDSNKAVKSWLREAQRPERTAAQDLRSCLGDITAQADLDEQDRVAYILASDELRNWLRTTTSQVLVVELRHSPRDQHFTASSYASAVLARSLTRTASPIVLTHLCSSRETDPENGTFAGGKGVLVSLVGQLASQIVSPKHRSGTGVPVDLGFLVNDKSAKFSRISNSTSKLLAVFERMLDLLPPASGTVYVILDGIWRLSPESKETKRVIAGLLNLAARLYTSSQRGEKRTVLKMFITEPFSTDLHEFISDGDDHGRSRRGPRRSMSPPSSSKHPYIKELSVPEHIPGGNRAGVNVAWVNEEVDAMIHECTSSSSSAGSANGSGAESEGREVYGSRRRPGDPWRKGKKDSQLSVGSGNRTSRRGLRRDQGRRSNSFSSDSDGD
ncbi:uncharacterized protein B0I36DRAFT_125097 [Microdochium trichocladiopsis]|uniref:Uncharacterized protein n=1 Tax=Microdochium trichocladiopsis TaxID=1682393 RepID=A0A9P8Y9W8_9PEZI|nr:uncharacterized protein B0I36DRAFT_125097 [Microdochium trichocladiopsis]KAH7031626.1 hypothetical protein B0I36DRAFT_125097 [Microdochium trichocladiopsis]